MEKQVIIKLLGCSDFAVDGKTISFEGKLAKQLAALISTNKMATREQIFQKVWPTLEKESAQAVFHICKRKVSIAFGFDFIALREIFYQPSMTYSCDVHQFLQAIGDEDWDLATLIYGGDFFPECDAVWAIEVRKSLKEEYEYALFQLAKSYVKQKFFKKAQYTLSMLLASNPIREDAVREIMLLPINLEEKCFYYEKLVESLEKMGLKPDPMTVQVFQKVMG